MGVIAHDPDATWTCNVCGATIPPRVAHDRGRCGAPLRAEVESLRTQLRGAVAEAERLACALEQVRAQLDERDLAGARTTLSAALASPAGGQ